MIRISIISPDNKMLDSCSLILQANGYEVFNASDAAGGLSIISQIHPEIIILDCCNKSSDENLRMLMSIRESNPGTSIILIKTAQMERGIDESGLVNDFLIKPFTPSELISKLKNSLAAEV